MNSTTTSAKDGGVVVIGGGFAGVTLAQNLERQLPPAIEIIVVSRDNHLVFTPMLPEVAARTLSPLHVVVAGRQMTKRARWVDASVKQIEADRKTIHFELSYGGVQSLEYGQLVLACGLDVNLDDIPGLAAYALPLKTVDDAFALGNALIGKFEQAAIESDPAVQARLLTTVVIGGGFSGVEIAGHLNDLAKNILPYYKFSKDVRPKMVVVQRGERILPELQHEALSEFALRKLKKAGIEVLLKTGVKEVGRYEVHLADGTRMPYGLLAGTIGNTASPFLKDAGLPLERNRIKTNATMRVEGFDSVWAIGDCAAVPNSFDDKVSPATAQFALRQAKQLATNIHRSYAAQPLLPFRFRPQGLLASIGQRNGVAEVYGLKFSGTIAWFFWRAVYFMKMPSLPRKIGIGIDWLMDAVFPENIVRVGSRGNPQFRKEHHVAGDVVYSEGAPSRTLYLIEKGTALVHTRAEQEPVARLRQGEHFGISAIERQETVHTSTVVAESSLDLIALDRPGLREMSRDGLNRELVRLLELRDVRQSWEKVIEGFPEVGRLRVEDAMILNPVVIRADETLQSVLAKMSSAIYLPIVDDDIKLIGSCDRADLSNALAKGMDPDTPARDFANHGPLTLSPTQSLRNATYDYLRSGVDAMPVVDKDGRLVGLFGLIEAAQRLSKQKV